MARKRKARALPDWDDDAKLLVYLRSEVAKFMNPEQMENMELEEIMPPELDLSAPFVDTVAIHAAESGDFGPLTERLRACEQGQFAPLLMRWMREQWERGGGALRARKTKQKKNKPRLARALIIEDIVRRILLRDYGKWQRSRDLKGIVEFAAEIAGVDVEALHEIKKRGG